MGLNRVKTPVFINGLIIFYKEFGYTQKSKIIVIFIGAIFSGLLEILGIVALYFLVKLLISINEIPQTHLISKVFSVFKVESYSQKISLLGIFIALTFILKNLYILNYYLIQSKILKAWKIHFSTKLMKGYLYADYEQTLQYSSSTILRNIHTTVNSAINGFILGAFNFYSNIITGVIILSLIYIKYYEISLMICCILILSTTSQNYWLKKRSEKIGKKRDHLFKLSTDSINQGFHAIKETKIFAKEDYFVRNFQELSQLTAKNDADNIMLSRLPTHLTEITIIISIVLICATVLSQADRSSNSLASLGALAAIAFRIAPIMNRATSSLQNMNKNLHSLKVLFKELHKLDESKKTLKKSLTNLSFKSSIEFKNVSFRYPGLKTDVLKNINLKIKKGTFVGIVGKSGSGKSTMIDLFTGLLTPTSGKILIDDVELTKNNRRSWHLYISLVPQSCYISNESLACNIAFGEKTHNISKGKMKRTISNCLLDDIETSLDGKPNSKLGENGKNISGGQRQRVSLARAFYKDREIYLLDEATSSLDIETERAIINLIKQKSGGKTIISIAHRLVTLIDADQIVLLEGNSLISGTPSTLYHNSDQFRKMCELSKISFSINEKCSASSKQKDKSIEFSNLT